MLARGIKPAPDFEPSVYLDGGSKNIICRTIRSIPGNSPRFTSPPAQMASTGWRIPRLSRSVACRAWSTWQMERSIFIMWNDSLGSLRRPTGSHLSMTGNYILSVPYVLHRGYYETAPPLYGQPCLRGLLRPILCPVSWLGLPVIWPCSR